MNNENHPAVPEAQITIDRKNLWRLETIGDTNGAEVQIYHPVLEDGSYDNSRKLRFCSLMQVTWMGQEGKLRFDIPAATLTEALDNFKSAGDAFAKATFEKLESERVRALLSSGMTIGEPQQRQ